VARTPRNVIIVGAGVIGMSVATVFWRAGDRVTVVEALDGPAQGVTSLGSGGFRHQFPYATETRLVVETMAAWRTIEQEFGIDLGLRTVGYALLATGVVDATALEQRATHLRAAGVEHRVLDEAGVRELLPGLRGGDLTAGLYTPGDGYTSPPAVVKKLEQLAADHGVAFRYGARVTEVLTDRGAVRGVRIEQAGGDERLDADLVINAAGLRAPEVGRLVGDELPVRAWRQHQFRSADLPGGGPGDFPTAFDEGESLYFRPDGAGVLVGYHEDDEAWAEDYTPTPRMAERCREALGRRWPELAAIGLERHWVGCYEVTPDRRALIGLSEGVTGSAYICGFSGHGLMNSMGGAQELRRLIDGEAAVVDVAELRAGRFPPA
jgi:sarcosine oxidase subunit beta